MPSVVTWMDLKIITLSEVSQTVKDKHHMISPIREILKKKKRIQILFCITDFEKLRLSKGTMVLARAH